MNCLRMITIYSGNKKTFEDFYTQYKNNVQSYVSHKIKSKEDAEDVISQIFLKAYSAFDKFDSEKASFSTWIYIIMKNEVCDFYRKNSKVNTVNYEDYFLQQELIFDIEKDIINKENLQIFYMALQKLPEREKDIIILKYFYNYSLNEIAIKLNLSYGNTKFLNYNAKKKLKKLLKDEFF